MTRPEQARPGAPHLTPVAPGAEPRYLPAEDAPEGMRLADYWRVVRSYKWNILTLALVAGIVGGLMAVKAVPQYRADAKLLVKFNMSGLNAMQPFSVMPVFWFYFETQSDIIRSRAISERVVDKLGLDERDGDPARHAGADSAPGQQRGAGSGLVAALDEWLPQWQSWIPEEWRPRAPPSVSPEGRRAALVSSLLSGLTVSGGDESEVIVLSYTSPNPQRAATLANAFAEAYIEFRTDSQVSSVQETSTWLTGRLGEVRAALDQSERQLREFQAREQMVDTENREQIISAKLGTLTGELIRAQTRRSEAEARYRSLQEVLDADAGYAELAAVIENPLVLEAHRQKAELERRIAELSQRYGERHPKMVAARADLRETTRRLDLEARKAVDGARKEYQLAAAQEREVRAIIEEQQEQVRTLSGKAFELERLEREVAANRRLYETLLDRLKETDVANEYDLGNVSIIDRAQPPRSPFKPNKERMVGVAVVIGLFLGVLLAFLRDHLDSTFKSREDVEEKLNLPVLGVLQKLRLRRRDRTVPERYALAEPLSQFSEAINDVRTAILFSNVDRPPKVVLVTSAGAGEGKTTLASNLALSFRQRGRTLLLDADLRKGRLQALSNSGEAQGLTDVVSGECSLAQALQPDPEAENLSVITAGTSPPNPLEIVSSKKFAKCLEALRGSFDYIVVDASPLLPVSDSVVVARAADCVVLALEADRTTHAMAEDAVKRLMAARIAPVGVVLQQVDARSLRSYNRGYNFYDGYYRYSYSGPRARS